MSWQYLKNLDEVKPGILLKQKVFPKNWFEIDCKEELIFCFKFKKQSNDRIHHVGIIIGQDKHVRIFDALLFEKQIEEGINNQSFKIWMEE